VIGRTLAHYEILEKLGEGGMGEVYLARDQKLAREVAIKLMPAELASDPQRRARFEREARTVAALNHPNVVTIHAVEEAEGKLFLVMERVQGVTLTRKIPDEGLELESFFRIAVPMCEAIATAHAAGITHRDLKPDNVMVDDAGRVKVLDFGLAKILDEIGGDDDKTVAVQTREGMILGTAAYMSPEQAEAKPVDERTDVFALGIILYEMLTGKRPFQGDTNMSTLTSVMRDDPVPVVDLRPELPRQFSRIVRRCLEKDPERRYESARGVRYDLEVLREDILSGDFDMAAPVETVARPSGTKSASLDPMLSRSHPPSASMPPQPAASYPRNRVWYGAALIVVLSGLGWWLWPGGETTTTESPTSTASPAKENPLVVVFPFENLGPPEDAYFAAGMTDEITTRLSGVGKLQVLSRSSATQYDRTGKSASEIAEDLGVDYLLEGAVRWQRSGNGPSRVRVTPQLVDTANGVQIWAESYDQAMEEIFAVQQQIAEAVVSELGVALGTPSGEPVILSARLTDNLDAYHFYLRATSSLTQLEVMEPKELQTVIGLLENALGLDPQFVEAWGNLARAHASMVHFGWDRSDERIGQSRRAMERALALDPDNASAQLGTGYFYYHALKQYEPALVAFERATELQPGNTELMVATGYVLRRQNRVADAMEYFWSALELSPNDASMLFDVSETLMLLRRYDESIEFGQEAIRQSPDMGRIYWPPARAALLKGDLPMAIQILDGYPGVKSASWHNRRVEIAYASRDHATALKHVEAMPDTRSHQFYFVGRELRRAQVLDAMGMTDRVPEVARVALETLEGELAANPGYANLLSAIAEARSFLGQAEAEQAVADAQRALELYPANIDTWIRSYRQLDLAHVLIRAGRHEEAVRELADLLTQNTNALSVGLLRNSPRYDALRDRADFAALVD
jgi:serine/threonine protein kinase/tetratricopeptide (TPR) repeat protein